jgi:hypothetical protein
MVVSAKRSHSRYPTFDVGPRAHLHLATSIPGDSGMIFQCLQFYLAYICCIDDRLCGVYNLENSESRKGAPLREDPLRRHSW